MKIFLISSDAWNCDDAKKIAEILRKSGHEVITDTKNKKAQMSDVLVIHADRDNILIGYQMSSFINAKKPVLILQQKSTSLNSLVPETLDNAFQYLTIKTYTQNKLEQILRSYFKNLRISTRRFNFFIAADLDDYLSWIPYAKHIPRAEFVRNLIREQMEEDEDYQKHLKNR
jgi:hypothetical protein